MQFYQNGKRIPFEKNAVHTLAYDEDGGFRLLLPRVKTTRLFPLLTKAVVISGIMSTPD